MVEIRSMSLPTNMYSIKCPYSMVPRFIVVHNTANDASAYNEIKYMQTNRNKVSFHYAVDDKEAILGLPLTRAARHAGDGDSGKGNRYGIAIEICYSKSGGARFMAAERNAAMLIAKLLVEYGWDISRVTTHRDYSGKYCPHRTLDLGWKRFISMISGYLSAYCIKPGDHVRVINTTVRNNRTIGTTYTGGTFVCWYDTYTVLSVKGDRAVIGIAGATTAAVNTRNLRVVT